MNYVHFYSSINQKLPKSKKKQAEKLKSSKKIFVVCGKDGGEDGCDDGGNDGGDDDEGGGDDDDGDED